MRKLIDSRQLNAFISLANHGSFTLAARELNLVQSAISHSIKVLEEDLGCRLFNRLGKKIKLTDAGEKLLHYATKILNDMEEARFSLENTSAWGKKSLRIGASTTATQYILPAVLREFKESCPEVKISIDPGDTPLAILALLENRIDIALALEPKSEPKLHFVPLFTDRLSFVVAPTHPWAERKRINVKDLANESFILYNKQSYTYGIVEKFFREENIRLKTVIEYGSMEAIKELVKIGLGIGILAPWIARKEVEEGSLIALPMANDNLKRSWGILYRKDILLSMMEETFISLCNSYSDNISHHHSLQ